MNRRELNLAIFDGTADKVLWQPRLETWIGDRMLHNTMPERWRGLSTLEIYDALRCSVRYAASAGLERYNDREDVVYIEERHPQHTVLRWRTPLGEISTVYQDIWEGHRRSNHRIVEFPVKTPQDLRVATYLVGKARFRADPEAFARAANAVGPRGEPTVFVAGSGFTELIKNWCGLLNTYYLLQDAQAEVEAFLEACDARDDRELDAALQLPCRIYNFGDHATNEFTPPPILKRYLIPRWQRLADRLHAAGRFCHTHWDGNSRTMLPYLRQTRLDGVEALTPEPMGDMTLEQIKAAVGEQVVVLDLLPTIDFLPNKPLGEMLDFARLVIDLFAPRLILGISDEISQVGQIEKVEAVSELVDRVCGLAD